MEAMRFFKVPGERPAVLVVLYVETLELLNVNCNTMEPSKKNGQINEHIAQDK